jgi:ubiquitin-protein ligase
MSFRLDRLNADYIRVTQLFKDNPHIHIKSVRGNPPEQYVLEYNIKGIDQQGKDIVVKNSHLVEINLPRDYPRKEPLCRMLTSIFHPNIAPHVICVTDHWTAAESLADLIVRIGQMISYQSYNIKSPRNGEAAKWAEQNINRFPIDNIELHLEKRPEEIVVQRGSVSPLSPPLAAQLSGGEIRTVTCQNCGGRGPITQFHECNNGHLVCPDCSIECAKCGKNLCILCPLDNITSGEEMLCRDCREGTVVHQEAPAPLSSEIEEIRTVTCQNCGGRGQITQFHECNNGHLVCPDCSTECAKCGKNLCILCPIDNITSGEEMLCRDCREGTVVHQEAPAPLSSEIEEIRTVTCQNCGGRGPITQFHECNNGHLVCPDCSIECAKCDNNLCTLCTLDNCTVGGELLCRNCQNECAICKSTICNEHLSTCDACGVAACPRCLSTCSICGRNLCKDHIKKIPGFDRTICNSCTANCNICGNQIEYPKYKLIKCERCGRFACKNHYSTNKDCCFQCVQTGDEKIRISYKDLHIEPVKGSTKGSFITGKPPSFCVRCGCRVEMPDAKFCARCGNKLS